MTTVSTPHDLRLSFTKFGRSISIFSESSESSVFQNSNSVAQPIIGDLHATITLTNSCRRIFVQIKVYKYQMNLPKINTTIILYSSIKDFE